jgi:hypothetical protein
MVVPRPFLTQPPPRPPGVFFLERTGRTKVEDDFGLEVRKLYRWTRPCSSRDRIDASIDSAAA